MTGLSVYYYESESENGLVHTPQLALCIYYLQCVAVCISNVCVSVCVAVVVLLRLL